MDQGVIYQQKYVWIFFTIIFVFPHAIGFVFGPRSFIIGFYLDISHLNSVRFHATQSSP